MAIHRPNRRRLKIHRTYTVEEAARVLGVAKGTVRRWRKNGLPAIDERKPTLLRGRDLLDYLAARAKPKQPCPPGQCYCVKCKGPRAPACGMAEFVVITPTNGNLKALCPTCGSLMHRRTSLTQFEGIRSTLEVTIVDRFARLRDSDQPSTNDH